MPGAHQRTAVSRWEALWPSAGRDAQLLSLLVAVVGLGKPDNGVMPRLGLKIIDVG